MIDMTVGENSEYFELSDDPSQEEIYRYWLTKVSEYQNSKNSFILQHTLETFSDYMHSLQSLQIAVLLAKSRVEGISEKVKFVQDHAQKSLSNLLPPRSVYYADESLSYNYNLCIDKQKTYNGMVNICFQLELISDKDKLQVHS